MNLLFAPLVRSSLGKKYLMAVTGLLLIGFVLAHMAGNLLIFAGPDALNSYAQALKARPALLWAARGGLLAVFVAHLILGLSLAIQNRMARPERYVYEDTLHASWASRNMLLTGLVLLAFLVYHLAHFTLGVVTKADGQASEGKFDYFPNEKNYLDLTEVKNPTGKDYLPKWEENYSQLNPRIVDARHDVYSMVVNGFQVWWISVSYLVAMGILGLHLWHGGSSFLQSLGLNSFRYAGLVRRVGPVLAVVVVAGNCSIPLAVMLGIVH